MSGMMIGMTTGMQTGMLLGAVLGATNGFFTGAMVGMILGVIVINLLLVLNNFERYFIFRKSDGKFGSNHYGLQNVGYIELIL